jgi:hypothetical protein
MLWIVQYARIIQKLGFPAQFKVYSPFLLSRYLGRCGRETCIWCGDVHGVFLYLSLDIRVNGVPLETWFVSYYCILDFYCLHCSDYVCINDPIAFLNPILVMSLWEQHWLQRWTGSGWPGCIAYRISRSKILWDHVMQSFLSDWRG